ncbi:16S rRNA (uracil(1498)-N(3))-methyltransferase [[Mycoplasma] anseris]|uniref:Ribosomal RNA small subunit methyltransferase E n=1 Tax=[Mycoplasma] anseris TaxID=92400 RepID=A0A2Z4NDW7_9BACT|nr:16S rRNA (uracil(1498)-N(3))-methyltransferase [[Mycoplasma] anseris]AWX69717.1 16S rRNA (uracil(1498)-N(3))-methyltransferase [[Mycoplasma] anseris]
MYKFFADQKENDYFILDKETINHLKTIRIKDNEVFLINYQDEFYQCLFEFPNQAKILKKEDINNENEFEIIACIPVIKANHFEIALQKSTELGVNKIIPFYSEYTEKNNLNILNKEERLLKIIKQAAQQSFRNKVPQLMKLHSFDEILNLNINNKILAYEKAKTLPLTKQNQTTLVIVGPEGGFSLNEIQKAVEKNVKIVSLTNTILRAETALIFMLCRII